ncbi:MBL fold metallo-hydrolase [Neobacillus mesonae]|uniref:MBL fold metallo-hydrolase n=1 Tax=Neobacillus mesonae TaxID=1193713 RepID=A0A3Q9QT54_9BACI|nr:MBL fold metallo-hydrolase [Neobacillus mesonae]AZU62683.1 MBL fold metallo-hydrolase [Neobacillus mesonae]
MFFRSFFDENLAHMSYLVGCQQSGEAIVIDPARNLQAYFRTAKMEGLKIIAAAETHIHADFLSGAKELAKQCGAVLYLSDEGDKDWKYQYLDEVPHVLVRDGSAFSIGHVEFQVLHTPGHTPESISFLLTDKGGGSQEAMGIFTGDFVFVGDIGRPDLLEKAAGVAGNAEIGARQMFQSLKKFKELPDFLQVWPAHGAGSACGKALGAVPVSTVGYEKRNNWALRMGNEEEFVNTLLSGQPEPPKYFAMMKTLNKIGPAYVSDSPLNKLVNPADLAAFNEEAVFLDTRPAREFAAKHYEGSINIPFNKSFTNWAGWLIPYDRDIVLIANQKEVQEIRTALASIGLDRIMAFIEPETALSHEDCVEMFGEVDVQELPEYLREGNHELLDVRNQAEWDGGRIESAKHYMLGTLLDRLGELDPAKTYILQCRSGARSAIAASLLQANGFKNVLNLKGGILAWKKEKFPVLR